MDIREQAKADALEKYAGLSDILGKAYHAAPRLTHAVMSAIPTGLVGGATAGIPGLIGGTLAGAAHGAYKANANMGEVRALGNALKTTSITDMLKMNMPKGIKPRAAVV